MDLGPARYRDRVIGVGAAAVAEEHVRTHERGDRGPFHPLPRERHSRAMQCGVAALLLAAAGAALADPVKLEVELNKLEPQDKSCRAFLVVNNDSAIAFETFKLDLFLFQPDGVIGRRFLVNIAPIKAQKRAVKQFDLEGIACDQVGSLLVNDVTECKAASGEPGDCLGGLVLKSLTKAQLTK